MKSMYALAAIAGCFLLNSQSLKAQIIADSLWLNEISVHATRVNVQDSYQAVSVQRIDSLALQRLSTPNLAGVLQWLSPVFVRDVGPGGLATFSARGFSSSQTQVIWNGFPLNHAMLGVTDLTLIPTLAIQSVAVSTGASNASFGDKGGGSVAIETKEKDRGLGAQYSVGSFNTRQFSVDASTGVNAWTVGVLGGFSSADNNFNYSTKEFSNNAGGFVEVEKERENNRRESATVLINLGRKKQNFSFNTKFWLLDSNNQIPGGISSKSTEANQEDAFTRWLSQWRWQLGKHRVKASAYVAMQQLDYVDKTADIYSISTTNFQAVDVSLSSSLSPNVHTIAAIQLSRSAVQSSEYPADVSRKQVSINAQAIWSPLKHLFVYPTVRFDSYSDFGNAYSTNIGINYALFKDILFLKASISRNFTAPTFNDLYWPALGNVNLKPEVIVKTESSIEFRKQWEWLKSSFEATFYQADMTNGIRWLPRLNGKTAPENIESLTMHGIEFSMNTQASLYAIIINVGGSLNQALASISEPRFENDNAVGKQLIYTPEWQFKGNASLQFKSLTTALYYAFVADRFTTSDHSSPFDPLPAYNTLNWVSSWAINTGKGNYSLQFAIKNLLNERYAVIRDYPMPGTHFLLTITTNFK